MRRVLVICDDIWHPRDVIERGIRLLEERNRELSFEIVTTAKDILTPEFLEEFPVILDCKCNAINAANQAPWFEEGVTEAGPAEFEAYIERGGIFAAVHSGTCYFLNEPDAEERFARPNDAMIRLLGEYFLGHPLRCPVTYRVLEASHPLLQGVSDFTERDEHYQIGFVREDPGRILMESVSAPGGTMPALYERRIGKGALLVLTPGHTLAVWKNGNFQQLLENICFYSQV